CEARCIIGVNDLDMFNPMPKRRKMIFSFVTAELFIGIEDFVIGTISNGMDGHTEADLSGLASMFKEFLAIHVENTAIFTFANIRLKHCRSMRAECAIHKYFDIANTEHIITKTAAQTKRMSLMEQFNRNI